jgi:hypothetical protein
MCDFVFWLFNVGEDTDPHARAYRERGNRSLSVGDVVQIEQHWFAVAAIGFTAIAAPLRLDGPARPLSTRIDLTAPDPVTGPGTDTPAPSGQEAHR